ncbi:three-helix bundle dimerization domain-containing protein [Modestobacter sp. SYSU DS0875]
MSAPTPPTPPTPPADEAVGQAVDRLVREFAGRPPATVTAIVRGARTELSGAPAGALPELVERLARQRLQATG